MEGARHKRSHIINNLKEEKSIPQGKCHFLNLHKRSHRSEGEDRCRAMEPGPSNWVQREELLGEQNICGKIAIQGPLTQRKI